MIWAYFSIRQSAHWSLQEQKIIIHLFAHSGVQHILCCVIVLFFFAMCTLCCQFLWIVHFRLPVPYSLTFIYNTPFWGAGSRSLLCRSCPGLAHLFFLSVDTAVILTFVLGLNCCRSRLITRKSLLTPA